MKVLIAAWYFPPQGGAGAQRPLHLARELQASGDSVIVVAREEAARDPWSPQDRTLLPLASEVDVRRVRGTPGCRSALSEGEFCRIANLIIESERPDIAIVTLSPFSLAGIARFCARRRIPCVVDLRDPWALDAWPGYRSYLHWLMELHSMRKCLSLASGFVMNTEDAMAAVETAFPEVRNRERTVVPNGWAREDFDTGTLLPRRVQGGEPFKIVHSGTFHRPFDSGPGIRKRVAAALRYEPQAIDRSGRSPVFLLKALAQISRRTRLRWKCKFLGVSSGSAKEWDSSECDAIEIQGLGYQPHSEAVRQIQMTDALFLPLGGLQSGERSLIVPGKTYEYLVAGPPIIAALPDGDARDLVSQSDRAFLCDPCNVQSIADAVEGAVAWRCSAAQSSSDRIPEFMRRFERAVIAEMFRAFLVRVLDSRSKS